MFEYLEMHYAIEHNHTNIISNGNNDQSLVKGKCEIIFIFSEYYCVMLRLGISLWETHYQDILPK